MLPSNYAIPKLPPQQDLDTIPVLRALRDAHRNLAELKGRAAVIPNQGILIDTLSLQEAKASSEIENIVTTQDELFRSEAALLADGLKSGSAKEVALYRDALKRGYDAMLSRDGVISNNHIIDMFRALKGYDGGFRT
jgi:Fic family protein